MPTIAVDSPEVAALELFKPQDSTLPSLAEAQKTFLTLAASVTGQAWELSADSNANKAYQRDVGGLLSSTGVAGRHRFDIAFQFIGLPDSALAVQPIFERLIRTKAVQKAIQATLELLKQAMEEVMGKVVQAVGAIPVYGWIVEAIYDVALGIVTIVKVFKQQKKSSKKKREHEWSTFSQDTDANFSYQLVERPISAGGDMTGIFTAPGWSGVLESWQKPITTDLLRGGGVRVVPNGAASDALGYIPGTSTIHQGFELSNRAVTALDLGRVLPLARANAISAWGIVNRTDTPQLFAVNTERAIGEWQQYLQQLRAALFESEHVSESARDHGIALGEKLFGWSPVEKGVDDPGIEKSIPVTALRRLDRIQRAAMDRSSVAYCALDAPAVVQRPDWRELVVSRRRDLLAHPAICEVDPEVVPDAAYRSGVELTQQERCGLKRALGRAPPPLVSNPKQPPRALSNPQGYSPPTDAPPGASPLLLLGVMGAAAAFLFSRSK